MVHNKACSNSVSQALGVLSIDKNIQDDDFVYLDNRALKVVTSESNLSESQMSLKKLLHEKLSGAGRKRFSRRSVKTQSITYENIKSLVHYIEKPRTRKNLLERRYQLFRANCNNFPDLVRKDMEKTKMTSLPSNIYKLCTVMTGADFDMTPMGLIKHLTTQCMDIDSNSKYETLEEERKECSELIHSQASSCSSESKKQVEYIVTLDGFHNIWQQKKAKRWNKFMLEPTISSCVHFSPIEPFSDKQDKSGSLDIDTSLLFQEGGAVSQKTIAYDHDSIITRSFESLDSTHDLLITEKATQSSTLIFDETGNETLLPVENQERSANQKTVGCPSHDSIITYSFDQLDSGQGSAITKLTQSISNDETKNNDTLSSELVVDSKVKNANSETIEVSDDDIPIANFFEELDLDPYSAIANKPTELLDPNDVSLIIDRIDEFISSLDDSEEINEKLFDQLLHILLEEFRGKTDVYQIRNHPLFDKIHFLRYLSPKDINTIDITVYDIINNLSKIKYFSADDEIRVLKLITSGRTESVYIRIRRQVINSSSRIRRQVINSSSSSEKIIALNDEAFNILRIHYAATTAEDSSKNSKNKKSKSSKENIIFMGSVGVGSDGCRTAEPCTLSRNIDHNGIKVVLVNGYMTGSYQEKSSDTSQRESAASPLLKPEEAYLFGARPKERTTQPGSSIKFSKGMNICDQNGFSDRLIDYNRAAWNDYAERKTNVLDYLDDLENEKKYETAKNAFLNGFWFPNQYFYLLIKACNVSRHQDFFKERLTSFVENEYLCNGFPPNGLKVQKNDKESRSRCSATMSNRFLHYTLMENVTPSEGVDSCDNNFWLTDQGTFMSHIIFKVILNFLGIKSFNQYFGSINKSTDPFELMSFVEANTRSRLLNLLMYNTEIKFEKAHLYVFKNHKNYGLRDFNGDFHNLYAFCDNSYPTVSFCSPCLPMGASIITIYQTLVNRYNQKPFNGEIMTANNWEMLKNELGSEPSLDTTDITMLDLIEFGGGLLSLTSVRVNFPMIEKIKLKYTDSLRILEYQLEHKEYLCQKEQERQKQTQEKKEKQRSAVALRHTESAASVETYHATCEVGVGTKQLEPDPIDELKKEIIKVKKNLKLYNNQSKETKKEAAIDSWNSLKSLYMNIKEKGIKIDIKDEHHYAELEEGVDTMLSNNP
ncbi:MAG: hypothetical protein KAG53_06420 [Endozoicomonadaceae bacterium]|nr:hypothetical protein [Endozoicomonadaceae bacterium]